MTESPWAIVHHSNSASSAADAIQSGREQSDQRILGRAATGRVSRDLGVQPMVARL
jgi:hypothetical protein